MKYILFFITLTVCSFAFSQADDKNHYLDLKEAVKTPTSIEYLHLDCTTDNCEKAFEDIAQYNNLKGLYISNYKGKDIGKKIVALSQLKAITIEKSPKLNLSRLFTNLKNIRTLTDLSIKYNDLVRIPQNISLLTNLKSINISDNNNLDLEKTIERIAILKNLESVYLPVNSISELPDNIGQLTNIKTLDISNNYLEGLPEGIGKLRNLEEISIEGNLIQSPSSSLKKIQSINLKYVSLDDELTEKERKRLAELFPNTKIKEIDAETSLDEKIENNLTNKSDPIKNDALEIKIDTPSPKKDNNVIFGELNIEKKGLKVYSQAYAHYAKVFQIKRFSTFDSTMFEERFLDTTYSYTSKIQAQNRVPSAFNRFRLNHLKNRGANEVLFDFYAKYNRLNPEINAFRGMNWVLAENYTKKDFKNEFIFEKGYKWYKAKYWLNQKRWRYWADVRLTYDNQKQNYTIKLKDINGFSEIVAYPIYSNSRTLEEAQKTYVSRYSKYSRSLNRRKRKFEKQLSRDKTKLERSRKENEKRKWSSFQKNYMSEVERNLSKEEWLIYYDKVIANERKALGNAAANIENIDRSLTLDGYTKKILWRDTSNQSDSATTIESIKTLYQDEDSNMLAVKKVLILNKDTKTYQRYQGSLGIKMIRLNLIEGANNIIITQLRNDDIGYITGNEYSIIKFPKSKEYRFTLKKIPAKFGSVQTVREELNF